MALYFKDRWWAKYMEDYDYDDGPRLRNDGLPFWVLVSRYRLAKGDKEKVLAGWQGWVSREELDAVLAYYEEFPEDIDRKLWRMEQY